MTLLDRLARGELPEGITEQIPPYSLGRAERGGGLVLCMEGAEMRGEVSVERGAWLYPHAQLSGALSAESLVVWAHTAQGEPKDHKDRARALGRAVLTPYGEVSATGELSAGAVGAPR